MLALLGALQARSSVVLMEEGLEHSECRARSAVQLRYILMDQYLNEALHLAQAAADSVDCQHTQWELGF